MEQYRVPNKLPSEEINILAQRKGRLKQAAKRTEPVARKAKHRRSFLKPDSFVADFRKAERDAKRIKRNFLKTGFRLPGAGIEENRLVLIFRHRGKRIANQNVIKAMRCLGLPFEKTASFQRLSPEVHAWLKIVEPYVIWGYPQMTVIHDLIYKYGAVTPPRTPGALKRPKALMITSNKVVEDIFGSLGIICVDDLIHEIMTIGPNFDAVRQRLRSFGLRNPSGGWKTSRKGKLRSIGGEAGFRGDEINALFKLLI